MAKAQKIFCIIGTRPEFIKMAPVYKALKEKAKHEDLEVKWILSSQHKDLLHDLTNFFEIEADHELQLCTGNTFELDSKEKKLCGLSAQILSEASKLFAQERPDLVIVQGDTMTVQQVALAAFYHKIQIAHIEAGIRTNDLYAPFPEELARRIVSQVANLNFAPTPKAFELLENEKVLFNKKHAQNFLVGNTVIDSLLDTVIKTEAPDFDWANYGDLVNFIKNTKSQNKKIILVTAHRRENISAHPELVQAIYKIAQEKGSEVEILISLHKNPDARKAFVDLEQQAKLPNIHLLEAISYPLFVKLMKESFLILTDSGGIQEEAPYLQTPVLVFRNETERMESIEAGAAKLIGTKSKDIYQETMMLLNNPNAHQSMIIDAKSQTLYGSGDASEKIKEHIISQFAIKALI